MTHLGRQDRRPDLREAVDPNARVVRGGGGAAGRPSASLSSVGAAARPGGDHRGHRPGAVSRYVDAIVLRTFEQERLEVLAGAADGPGGELAVSDFEHPCQALADLLTVRERLGAPRRPRAHLPGRREQRGALAAAGGREGRHARAGRHAARVRADPAGGAPGRGDRRARPGGRVEITNDPRRPPTDADVLYTDVWAQHGPGGGDRRACAGVPRLPAGREARRPRRRESGPPLPAGPPGPGDHRRGDRRSPLRGVGPGREPAPHPEGAPAASARPRPEGAVPRSNDDVEQVLLEYADLLAIAARRPVQAARLREGRPGGRRLPRRPRRLDVDGVLAIPNVGKSIADKIRVPATPGTFSELEELGAQIPAGRPRDDRDPRVRSEEGDGRSTRSSASTRSTLVAAVTRAGAARRSRGSRPKTEENVAPGRQADAGRRAAGCWLERGAGGRRDARSAARAIDGRAPGRVRGVAAADAARRSATSTSWWRRDGPPDRSWTRSRAPTSSSACIAHGETKTSIRDRTGSRSTSGWCRWGRGAPR